MIASSVNTRGYQINGIFIRAGRKLNAPVDIPGKDAVFKLQGLGPEKWLHLLKSMFI